MMDFTSTRIATILAVPSSFDQHWSYLFRTCTFGQ